MAHLKRDQIDRYLARTLSPAEIAALHDHVAVCEDCRMTLDQASGKQFETAFVSDRDGSEAAVPQGSGAKWLFLAAGITVVVLVAVAFQYVPHKRTLSSASLYDSGVPIELDPNGVVQSLNEASGLERDQVSAALRDRALPVPPSSTNQAPAPSALIAPLNARVLSDRPTFSWNPLPDATSYEVTVTNRSLAPLAHGGPITQTEWQPPNPLPRGENLFWRIRAAHGNEMITVPDPPAPPIRFDIVSAEVAYRIRQLRASNHPSHLLMAVIFDREGMYADAAAELQSLAKENPGSALVQSLQKSLSVQNAGRK